MTDTVTNPLQNLAKQLGYEATLKALEDHLQANLEYEMKQAGVDQYLADLSEAHGHNEGQMPHGRKLLQQTLISVRDEIAVRIKDAFKGNAGRNAGHAPRVLKEMDWNIASFLTGKALIDGVSIAHPLNRVAVRLGGMIEDEQRLSKFAKENRGAFKWTMERMKDRGSRERRRGVSRKLMKLKEVSWSSWSHADRLKVGVWLIDAFNHATGLFRCEQVARGVKTEYVLVPQEGTLAWIEKVVKSAQIAATEYWPTIVPPKPWRRPWGGGYHTPLVPRLPAVKTKGHAGARAYLEELSNRDLTAVYDALNRVQETAWAVNAPVLDVLRQIMERGIDVSGLPPAGDEPAPPKPHDIDTNEAARKWWRKGAAMVRTQNLKNRSRRIQVARSVHMAEKLQPYGTFYFPHNMDFRGRMYAVPPFLNPQGADYAKGLLTFAEGKPIETEEHLEWLAVHGANCYGVDKVSFADRWNWVVDNNGRILSAADSPLGLGLEFWTGADNPFQFLAWCIEWAKVYRGGFGTISNLPVALDGSCNGLQHYSAALRDPIGGAAVNLIPAEKPQDIYGVVAERVVERLQELKDTSGPEGEYARQWLVFGVDRKITKRPVMTLPYGCTLYTVREFVEDAMREKLGTGKPNVFARIAENGAREDGLFDAAKFLQPIVWEAIGRTVVAARGAMDWLQKVANVVSKDGLPITWETPDGFVVMQAYVDQKNMKVQSKLDGKLVDFKLAQDGHLMDSRRQANGIAPNWVHSMDATALRVFVCAAAASNIKSFSLVHDSYGTLAADVPQAAALLRSAFIALYAGRDVLAEFREELSRYLEPGSMHAVPPSPPCGNLNLELIHGSLYFFA